MQTPAHLPTDFTPSDAYGFPLPGAFRRVEAEVAAFVLIATFWRLGRWFWMLTEDQVETTIRMDRSVRRILSNPFHRMDFHELVVQGAISHTLDVRGVQLHPFFFERIRPLAIRSRERMIDFLARDRWVDEGGPCIPS